MSLPAVAPSAHVISMRCHHNRLDLASMSLHIGMNDVVIDDFVRSYIQLLDIVDIESTFPVYFPRVSNLWAES